MTLPGSQSGDDTHTPRAVGQPPRPADHIASDTHKDSVGGASFAPSSHLTRDNQASRAAGGPLDRTDHAPFDTQRHGVGAAGPSPTTPNSRTTPIPRTASWEDSAAALIVLADLIDGLEALRIRTTAQAKAITDDLDQLAAVNAVLAEIGVPTIDDVRALVKRLEDKTRRDFSKVIAAHPLGQWILAQPGLGLLGVGRLLALIDGDPYLMCVHKDGKPVLNEDGTILWVPRTVSQLWHLAGWHVLPADHMVGDTQSGYVGGDPSSDPGHGTDDTHDRRAGVAERPVSGRKVSYNPDLRVATRRIVDPAIRLRCEACTKAERARRTNPDVSAGWAPPPAGCTCEADGYLYRAIYDQARVKCSTAVHGGPCSGTRKLVPGVGVRAVYCKNPDGSIAGKGDPLNLSHQEARAIRITAKEFLKALWREAKRLHEIEETR